MRRGVTNAVMGISYPFASVELDSPSALNVTEMDDPELEHILEESDETDATYDVGLSSSSSTDEWEPLLPSPARSVTAM